ncbi:MAG: hypothetical protein R3E79_24230 [Caldilineaceae bacterium]
MVKRSVPYDRNGNRLPDGGLERRTAFASAADQPTSVTDHKGRQLAYTYDGTGNRIGAGLLISGPTATTTMAAIG